MSIMSSLSRFVRSLTSDKANTDVPPGTHVPPTDDGPVPRPDRAPAVGAEAQTEPERQRQRDD